MSKTLTIPATLPTQVGEEPPATSYRPRKPFLKDIQQRRLTPASPFLHSLELRFNPRKTHALSRKLTGV